MATRATDSPECKLCKHRHRLNEPHVFDGPARPLTPAGEAEAPVTAAEIRLYERYERIIKAAFARFTQEAGEALAAIRDQRLYRIRYATFEDFCLAVTGHPRSWANRRIAQTSPQILDHGPDSKFRNPNLADDPKSPAPMVTAHIAPDAPPAVARAIAEVAKLVVDGIRQGIPPEAGDSPRVAAQPPEPAPADDLPDPAAGDAARDAAWHELTGHGPAEPPLIDLQAMDVGEPAWQWTEDGIAYRVEEEGNDDPERRFWTPTQRDAEVACRLLNLAADTL